MDKIIYKSYKLKIRNKMTGYTETERLVTETLKMQDKINMIHLEFSVENSNAFLEIGSVLQLIENINNGNELELIKMYFKTNDKTFDNLMGVVEGINSNRKYIRNCIIKHNINPNLILLYKDIDHQDYLYLLS
jgi:hypothetical protein